MQPSSIEQARRYIHTLLRSIQLHHLVPADFYESVITLAARCLATVEVQFGRDAMHPGIINGHVEHNLPATYHNAIHTRTMMMRDSLAYASMRSLYDGAEAFSAHDQMLLLLAASCHDIIQGNGRGTDEHASASLARQLMEEHAYHFTEEDCDKVYHAILATVFNPITKEQAVTLSRPYPHMQEALAIGDLLSLCRPDGPVHAIAHVPEFFLSQQSTYEQVMRHEAARDGFALAGKNLVDYLRYIGTNRTLRETFGRLLADQAAFFRNHAFWDPRVDDWFAGRTSNANFMQYKLAPDYTAGTITPLDAYELAKARARVLFCRI